MTRKCDGDWAQVADVYAALVVAFVFFCWVTLLALAGNADAAGCTTFDDTGSTLLQMWTVVPARRIAWRASDNKTSSHDVELPSGAVLGR